MTCSQSALNQEGPSMDMEARCWEIEKKTRKMAEEIKALRWESKALRQRVAYYAKNEHKSIVPREPSEQSRQEEGARRIVQSHKKVSKNGQKDKNIVYGETTTPPNRLALRMVLRSHQPPIKFQGTHELPQLCWGNNLLSIPNDLKRGRKRVVWSAQV